MQKGTIQTNTTSTKDTSALRYLKEGESILVGVDSIHEFVVVNQVGVYDNLSRQSVILPVVVPNNATTLFQQAVDLLWDDYRKEMEVTGTKNSDPHIKAILNKINMLKAESYIYFGFKDIKTGEDIFISAAFRAELGPDDRPKGGNNLLAAISKLEKNLKKFPLEITKGSLGAWTVLPYMDDLTPEEEANFKATAPIDVEKYQEVMFFTTPESEEIGMKAFSQKYGFDLSRLTLGSTDTVATEVDHGF